MSRSRRPRTLSHEERELWALVARGITPLRGRSRPEKPPEPEPPPAAPPAGSAPPSPAPPAKPTPKAPALPPLAPVERRLLSGLRRGSRRADAVIDLHGLRQDEAHHRLIGFLHGAQARGHVLVIVITGKGGASPDQPSAFAERGVLRRMVPHWLRLPELRPLVLGFEEAAPQHGGAGALYVRLRRRPGSGGDRDEP